MRKRKECLCASDVGCSPSDWGLKRGALSIFSIVEDVLVNHLMGGKGGRGEGPRGLFIGHSLPQPCSGRVVCRKPGPSNRPPLMCPPQIPHLIRGVGSPLICLVCLRASYLCIDDAGVIPLPSPRVLARPVSQTPPDHTDAYPGLPPPPPPFLPPFAPQTP